MLKPRAEKKPEMRESTPGSSTTRAANVFFSIGCCAVATVRRKSRDASMAPLERPATWGSTAWG